MKTPIGLIAWPEAIRQGFPTHRKIPYAKIRGASLLRAFPAVFASALRKKLRIFSPVFMIEGASQSKVMLTGPC
jgi:hypothetical protein